MHYRVGEYQIDPAKLMLTKDGALADIGRRVFDCILYLLQHRDRAVGRDELILNLWGRDNVSDNQLARVVVAARRAFGDDGEAQKVIRTVAGVGYHWIGPAVEVRDSTGMQARAPVAAQASLAEEDALTTPSGPFEMPLWLATNDRSRRRRHWLR